MLIQDCYKEKGYGTAVERTVLEYGFKELGLSVIYADVVLRNSCFLYTSEAADE